MNKMNKLKEQIIDNALADLTALDYLREHATDNDMYLVYLYHEYLNHRIIAHVLSNNMDHALKTTETLKQSIKDAEKYYVTYVTETEGK